jgi:membrane protease YdiL (CAAX protease family)
VNIQGWFVFKPEKGWWVPFLAFIACVLCNFMADVFVGTSVFHLFYQGIFVLGICISFPLWFTAIKQKQPLATIGITTNKWGKAVLVGLLIAALSSFGRIKSLQLIIPAPQILFNIVAGMIMSTLFEEIFFRGFLQTGFEKNFGIIPAILLAGSCFSLYHIGYSNVRGDVPELISLFCIGIFFSISFRITNNIITSYIVNLPQAILTFIGEPRFIEYSKHINSTSAVISLITTAVGLVLIVVINSRNTAEQA